MNPRLESLGGLYPILDSALVGAPSMSWWWQQIKTSGRVALQLRVKEDQELRAQLLTELYEAKGTAPLTLLLNDDVLLARDLGADGVHLGRYDMPTTEARRLLGAEALIGYSTHSLAEVEQAQALPVDYLAFGVVLPTATKGFHHPVQGLAQLAQAVKLSAKPIVAIGGIKLDNLKDVLATGAFSAAMISAWMTNEFPGKYLQQCAKCLAGR